MKNKIYDYILLIHVARYPEDAQNRSQDNPTDEIVSHLTAGYEIHKSIPTMTDTGFSLVLFILRKEI